MSTAIVTHKDCILHETGINHPESKERLIAVNKSLKAFKSSKIKWFEGQEIESKYFYEVQGWGFPSCPDVHHLQCQSHEHHNPFS